MRSLSRAVVVGALTLPLAFSFAGFASAAGPNNDKNDHDNECVWYSCNSFEFWHITDDDQFIFNQGIIEDSGF